MPITVRRELYAPAPDKNTIDNRSQRYVRGSGLKRVEHRSLQREADWSNEDFERYSEDNGRTWGEWRNVRGRIYEAKGGDELVTHYGTEAFNARYGHMVSVGMRTLYFDGHTKAFEKHWGGAVGYVNHSLLVVRTEDSDQRSVDLIKYEAGDDFDPANWRKPGYTDHNRAAFGCGVDVLDDGGIIFPIAADVRSCCRIRGLDVNEVFPSCPHIMHGLIVARGIFDEDRGNYRLTFSRPIVISDLRSSRGVNEPNAVMLPSGRILAVFRGSNVQTKARNTRIEAGAPAHKWYCYSDDGGQAFTEPEPWHFDDREVFYSASSHSLLVKSIKNQRIYWIGNISDHTAYGNHPRHPLVIAQVDDRGLLIKDTLTTIDKREPGDSDKLCLTTDSGILQDRETGLIELYLNKELQREGYHYWADCYRYFIDVDGHSVLTK
jgi:hypothetical protein